MKTQIDNKSLYFENIGDNKIYYSYNTTVAFETPTKIFICENVWSVTTAKHLNRIEEITGRSKADRIKYKEFIDYCESYNINKTYN